MAKKHASKTTKKLTKKTSAKKAEKKSAVKKANKKALRKKVAKKAVKKKATKAANKLKAATSKKKSSPATKSEGSVPRTWAEKLATGQEAVKAWDEQNCWMDRSLRNMRKANFAGADLTRIKFSRMDLAGSDFTSAKMSHAHLHYAKLRGANFSNADLRSSGWLKANCKGVNLSGADLSDASFREVTNLGDAILDGTNFTGVNFSKTELTGADLSTAILKDNHWDRNTFDNVTQFPAGFELPVELVWKGTGSDPRTGSQDFQREVTDREGFLQRLPERVSYRQINLAMQMLRKDGFQLYSDIDSDGVRGVIRSQTDAMLVYACTLGSDGHFRCGTQNLRPCGGTIGGVCKHLLVLVMGLVQTGELDPGDADLWLQKSKSFDGDFNPHDLSEIFLRYKGASIGDVDWRPAETLPEDYAGLWQRWSKGARGRFSQR